VEIMPASKTIKLTQEGLDKLVLELNRLKLEERPRVITALKEARAQGDLSENAEYDSARTEQGILESRILELEQMIEHATIVEEISKDKVSVGCKVTLKIDGETEVYSIVGSIEADPFNNKISYESPIAKAILDKKVKEKAMVDTPNGKYEVEIISID
jgi:transcription elongation factor GreA